MWREGWGGLFRLGLHWLLADMQVGRLRNCDRESRLFFLLAFGICLRLGIYVSMFRVWSESRETSIASCRNNDQLWCYYIKVLVPEQALLRNSDGQCLPLACILLLSNTSGI